MFSLEEKEKKYFFKTSQGGFTLIESLVFLFVFSLITLSFYNVITLGTRYIVISKNRLSAAAIANEKMEIIRNLSYDDVGVVGAACNGSIPQDEDVEENGRSFHVNTMAVFIDDSFDGNLGGSPNDTSFHDYKTVKVTVSWDNSQSDQGEISLTSRFVPPGLEAATTGDGILSINIFSNPGALAVSGATVQIVNNDLGFSETRETDSSGNVMIVGAQESINRYEITVSKNGYETVNTYIPYPDSTFNPVDVHASVIAGNLNMANLEQNKTGSIRVISLDNEDQSVSDVDFILSGGRVIGYDPVSASSIYNLNASENTGSDGEGEFSSVSPGQYSFSLSPSETDYQLIGTNPPSPFSLASEDELELSVYVAEKNVTSLLIEVVDQDDLSHISGATVKLTNSSGYSAEITTDGNGTAFFPKEGDSQPFLPGEYVLEVTASGYNNYSNSQTVVGGTLAVPPKIEMEKAS